MNDECFLYNYVVIPKKLKKKNIIRKLQTYC